MEEWDILDRNGKFTGRRVTRNRVVLARGDYHLVVHIWVVGSDGRILIQRRSDTKPLMPGEWAATGGAAISGESSLQAAKRELFEELSIEMNVRNTRFVKRLIRRNSLLDIYLVRCNTPTNELKIQKEEVAEVKRVHINHLKRMIKTGKFHNYGKEYFDTGFNAIAPRSKRHFYNHKNKSEKDNGKAKNTMSGL